MYFLLRIKLDITIYFILYLFSNTVNLDFRISDATPFIDNLDESNPFSYKIKYHNNTTILYILYVQNKVSVYV